ncbi:hypothetical protein M3Y98_00676400 [Aphelenchoides besseyi]|nr:hypothetical protein M3Y98_00676400 [Aphelenchoides besseyi]
MASNLTVIVPVTTTMDPSNNSDQLKNVNCCCIDPIRMRVVAIGTIDLIVCIGAFLGFGWGLLQVSSKTNASHWIFKILLILSYLLGIAADICLIIGALKKIWILLTLYIITAVMVYISCAAIALLSTCSFWLFYKGQRVPQMTILGVFAISVMSAISPVVAIRYRKPAYFLPFIIIQWVLAALVFVSQMIMIETALLHFYRLIRWKTTLTALAFNLFMIIVYFLSVFPILRARSEMKRELRTGVRSSKSRSSIMYVDNPNEVLEGTGEEQYLQNNRTDGYSGGKEEMIEL